MRNACVFILAVVAANSGCSSSQKHVAASLEEMQEWANRIQEVASEHGSDCIVSFRGHDEMFLCQVEGETNLGDVMPKVIRDYCNEHHFDRRIALADVDGTEMFVCVDRHNGGKLFVSWRSDAQLRSYAFFSLGR